MRIFILMVLLTGISSGAMAEQKGNPTEAVEVGNGFNGDRVFAYPSSIKKAGSEVKMWDLFNSATPQALPGHAPYLSKVTQVQYRCTSGTMRTLYTNIYSKPDGKGNKILFTDTTILLEWTPVAPGSAYEALLKFACEKK